MLSSDIAAHITEQAFALRDKLINLRRTFCVHPELSGEEVTTAQIVSEHLTSLGLEVETGVGGHGVVGILRGQRAGATLAYRADMDAMPIQDALDTPYRAWPLGIKHACGHDAHMAIALGVAEILCALHNTQTGTVKFIFQPAEESLGGAKAMIEAGVLQNPQPEAVFALHTFPIPVGQIGLSTGLALAGMEEFRVRLYAPAGNIQGLARQIASALRDLSTDIAPTDFVSFNAVVEAMRDNDAHRQTIFVSCWPNDLTSPQNYHVMGLLSIPSLTLRVPVHKQIRKVLDSMTDDVGATYDLTYTFQNPPVINDVELVRKITPILEKTVGLDKVLTFKAPYPFAHEDFALYQEQIPGVFLWLGTANPQKGITSLLHQADFDIDEDALVMGTRLMATMLMAFLS